jgi:RNA polymerase sigma factor (sigma-70 family)
VHAIGFESDCHRQEKSRPVGDDSFTTFWNQYRADILQLCRRAMRNEADAEEAFSRASLLLYRKLPEHRNQIENLRGWILRLTFNVCMSLHRENRRRGEQSLDDMGPDVRIAPVPVQATSGGDGDPERSYLLKEMGDFLWKSIDALPDRLRSTVLSHLSHSSYREVADRLAINETNVRKRMQEAREILARRLAEYRSGAVRPPLPSGRRRPADASVDTSAGRTDASADTAGRNPLGGIRSLRSIVVSLPSGVETEALLPLRTVSAGNPAKRRRVLERYVEKHPRGWKKRFELACTILEEGRAEEAISHLEPIVRQQPRQVEPWLALISAYRGLEQPQAAADACGRALATRQTEAATAMLRGLQAQCLGLIREAELAFGAACQAAPESPSPWVCLAEIQAARGRPTETIAALDAALARDPCDVAALTLGQEALRLAGRSSESRQRADRALDIDPGNPRALERWLAACARAAGGRLEPGGPRWKEAERLARHRPATRALLAYLRSCRGDLTGVGDMALLVRERPMLRQAWTESARLLDALGHPSAALEELDAGRTLQLPSRDLDVLACRLAARAGLAERMRHEADALLVRHGDAWEATATAAWVLAQLGMEGHALDLSHAAVERQPCLPVAWLEHARVLSRCGRLRAAVAAAEAGWNLLPDGDGFDLAAPAALDLAALHRLLGGRDEARAWARHALEACVALAASDPVQARIFHARALAELGVPETASSFPGAVAGTAAFHRIEERRALTTQLSEASFG